MIPGNGDARRVVYKDTYPLADTMVMELPESARLLHVADQRGDGSSLTVWSLGPPGPADEPQCERVMKVLGTGQEVMASELQGFGHWATVVTAGGSLVWHVFLDFDGAAKIPSEDRSGGRRR